MTFNPIDYVQVKVVKHQLLKHSCFTRDKTELIFTFHTGEEVFHRTCIRWAYTGCLTEAVGLVQSYCCSDNQLSVESRMSGNLSIYAFIQQSITDFLKRKTT